MEVIEDQSFDLFDDKRAEPFNLRHYDTNSCIVTEDEYKAIKVENNLDNLNKDIEAVNEEIEQIKKLLFTHQDQLALEEGGDSNEALSALSGSPVLDSRRP